MDDFKKQKIKEKIKLYAECAAVLAGTACVVLLLTA